MVHILSREGIDRMSRGRGKGSGSGGGSQFDMSMLSGYATEQWCNETFVTIAFFDQLFQLYDDEEKITVNGELPVDTSKLNIKAMFGFWTDFYISALGNGGQVGASIYLSSLADVNVAGVQLGQVLTWKRDPSDGVNKWMAGDVQSGVDMTVVWNALAASTNEQIAASHLSTAFASASVNYATTAGSATYATSAGSAQSSGYASSIPQHTLWGQTFDGTADVSGDMTNVGYMGFSHNETQMKYSNTNYTDPAPGDTYNWKFGGSVAATYLRAQSGVLSDGYVTALSDERDKNIIEHFEISLEYIAQAPIVSYEWKDKERHGEGQHVGSIAQYWLRELPELVPELNGRYSMDYGRIALLSAITDARHIVNLEQRVARLERRLKNE